MQKNRCPKSGDKKVIYSFLSFIHDRQVDIVAKRDVVCNLTHWIAEELNT